MASISKTELRSAIKELLKGADLDSLSAKKIRIALQEKFDTDFSERKKEVDEIVMQLLDEGEADNETSNGKDVDDMSNEESVSESEEDEPPKKKSKPSSTQASKTKHKSPAEVPEDDEEIARQLQEDGRRRSGRTPRKAPKEKKKERKKDGERKAKGYGKPCLLSPALAEVMGTDRLPRCDVVKKMYEIAREKNLQDPKNKQFMICDDALLKIFGKKRVRMFGMMKHLNDHITDPHKIGDLS